MDTETPPRTEHRAVPEAAVRAAMAQPEAMTLFSTPGEVCFDVAGDLVTEDLDRILAAVCGAYVRGA
ncbi:DUF1186 domain-containing protein [Thiocapsa rosea]|uniref:Uncharacterized protein DUF1186 n=1 Tax=Thiocapsa rosea TaxID=69360 RepID=A0A495V3B7_9GAMM|nr:DUF1186 domain-containing protein [Thiocapsa rosea]RKT43190.1 uncharacterized protein DUF1186 [Thiocapsa rosea]